MTQMKDLARQYLDQAYFIGGDGLLYTNSCAQVYQASLATLVWSPLNATPFNWVVKELTVSQNPTEPVVYACLGSEDPAERLRRLQGMMREIDASAVPRRGLKLVPILFLVVLAISLLQRYLTRERR